MSRSYKKNPIVKDNGKSKQDMKRYANRVVRKTNDIANGSSYKKVFNSWTICDWRDRYSREEAIRAWLYEESEHARFQWRHKKYKTLDKWLAAWYKMMLRK